MAVRPHPGCPTYNNQKLKQNIFTIRGLYLRKIQCFKLQCNESLDCDSDSKSWTVAVQRVAVTDCDCDVMNTSNPDPEPVLYNINLNLHISGPANLTWPLSR